MTAPHWSRCPSPGRNSPCLLQSRTEEAKGFSLFMMKAVLSGRGDEVIDLAKVNLFR